MPAQWAQRESRLIVPYRSYKHKAFFLCDPFRPTYYLPMSPTITSTSFNPSHSFQLPTSGPTIDLGGHVLTTPTPTRTGSSAADVSATSSEPPPPKRAKLNGQQPVRRATPELYQHYLEGQIYRQLSTRLGDQLTKANIASRVC